MAERPGRRPRGLTSLSVGCAWIVASISSSVSFERDGEAEFGDHFGGFVADDVRAEDFAVRLADDQFHKALALADRRALPLARKGNLPTLNLRPFSFAARSVRPTLATCGWQ